jgi:hypothetical protein
MLAKLFVRYGVVVGVQKTRQSCSMGVAQKKKKDVDGRRLLFATYLVSHAWELPPACLTSQNSVHMILSQIAVQ